MDHTPAHFPAAPWTCHSDIHHTIESTDNVAAAFVNVPDRNVSVAGQMNETLIRNLDH
jgi:hypothetical protein